MGLTAFGGRVREGIVRPVPVVRWLGSRVARLPQIIKKGGDKILGQAGKP